MNLKNTKSLANVKAAFTGESLARNKYTYYAMQAKKEGYDDIADLFEKMAKNETTHAKIWFSLINDGLGTTEKNIEEAASGENSEWTGMYPGFARIAREEGLEDLAVMFEKVADIEQDHERQFLKALIKLKSAKGGKPAPEVVQETKPGYRCMFCGGTFEHRPDVCSVCGAIGSFESCEIDV